MPLRTNVIHNEDCLVTMGRIPDNSIDLVVTSPPYNKGWYAAKIRKTGATTWRNLDGRKIAYDVFADSAPPCEYEEWQRKVLEELLRIIKPSGSIFYNHKDILYKGHIVPPKWVYDFPVRQQIVWNRKSSCQIGTRYFMPAHEWIYWICKDPKKLFFRKDRALHRTNIWTMPFARKNPHPAPFPTELADNCVLTCCPPNGIVYDPFMGSGSTAVSAAKFGARYIGSEISADYCEMAYKRIHDEEKIRLS